MKINNSYLSIKKKKRILTISLLLLLLVIISVSIFTGCKSSSLKNNAKNISTYTINLSFDDDTKTLTGSQSVDYINSTQVVLNEVWFHLYPNAFSEKAKTKPVSNLYKDKAYPNGEDFGNININKVMVENSSKEIIIKEPDDEVLVVKLGKDLYPEDRVHINIEFSVVLPNSNSHLLYSICSTITFTLWGTSSEVRSNIFSLINSDIINLVDTFVHVSSS